LNNEERETARILSFYFLTGPNGLDVLPAAKIELVSAKDMWRRHQKALSERKRYSRIKEEKRIRKKEDAKEEELEEILRDLQKVRTLEVKAMTFFGHNGGDCTPLPRDLAIR
jgi:hypothetical protein